MTKSAFNMHRIKQLLLAPCQAPKLPFNVLKLEPTLHGSCIPQIFALPQNWHRSGKNCPAPEQWGVLISAGLEFHRCTSVPLQRVWLGGRGGTCCKCVRVSTHKHPRVQKPSTLLITSNALMPDKLSGMFYPWGCASLGARTDALPFVLQYVLLWTLQQLSYHISLLPPAPHSWARWGWAEVSRNWVF